MASFWLGVDLAAGGGGGMGKAEIWKDEAKRGGGRAQTPKKREFRRTEAGVSGGMEEMER